MYWQIEAKNQYTMTVEADSQESAIGQYCAQTGAQPEDVVYCILVEYAF